MTTFQIGDMIIYEANNHSIPFFYVVVDKTRKNYILMSLATGENYPVHIKDSKYYKKVS